MTIHEDTFEIENNISYKKSRKRDPKFEKLRSTLLKLEIGQSFFVPNNFCNRNALAYRINVFKKILNRNLIIRSVSNSAGKEGQRIWRLDDTEKNSKKNSL